MVCLGTLLLSLYFQMGSIGGGAFESSDASDNQVPVPSQPSHSVFKPGMGPQDFGTAYRPYQEGGRPMTYIDRMAEKKQVEEVLHHTISNNFLYRSFY